jgi:hypothetical protein
MSSHTAGQSHWAGQRANATDADGGRQWRHHETSLWLAAGTFAAAADETRIGQKGLSGILEIEWVVLGVHSTGGMLGCWRLSACRQSKLAARHCFDNHLLAASQEEGFNADE